MSHLDKIDIKLPAEKLDGFLDYPLLNYAHVLAEVLMEPSGGYPIFEIKESKIDNQLKDIKKIKEKHLYQLHDYSIKYSHFKGYDELKNEEEREKFLVEKSKLKPHFESLTPREEESELCNKISYKKTSGRKIDKKYKIASIWGLMMRSRKRIVWPDIIRFYNEKSSTWETRVRSSLEEEIVSSVDWPNVVGLLDWFHNKLKKTPYGGELKLPYDIIKYEGRVKYLKRRCSLIIKKDVKDAISNFRVFIPEGLPVEIRFIPHSIKFNKKSIEINGIREKSVFTRKVDFTKDRKFSFDYSISKQLSSITFPNGEIFQAPTTREMLISTLVCLSGLKFL
jgi:hypothetical protein